MASVAFAGGGLRLHERLSYPPGMSSASPLASTPEPPYWAVIFTSVREEADDGYGEVADRMEELAVQQPGYLGIESVRAADGSGITISYWATEESLRAWKANAEHRVAQRKGHEGFYKAWVTRVCKVERAYAFELGQES